MRKACALLVVACGLLALEARADVCSGQHHFTVNKDSIVHVVLGESFRQFAGPGSDEPRFTRRFILDGLSAGNDISCDFQASFQLYCLTGELFRETTLSDWKLLSKARDGGRNQCVWDGAWNISGLDSLTIPAECTETAYIHLKFEANVRNKGKLQVVDILSGSKGCSKP